ncbi:MAG TPA: hypothetical protein VL137_05410 [Polyangiaceae bacterium]|nr:hypothetical protein [Polyangiaceae bacterium]
MASWPLILGARRPAQAPQPGRTPAHPLWQFSGLLLSALISPLAHHYFHPLLRVLNLGSASFTLLVDGQALLTLPPTSSESPFAGAELRLGAGAHQFAIRNAQGITMSQTAVHLVAGAVHLYAPLRKGQCFWLETAHYGRAGDAVDRQALSPDEQFWLLPAEVDFWFTAPPAGSGGSRLSGGAVTAVRQGPCPPPREAQ